MNKSLLNLEDEAVNAAMVDGIKEQLKKEIKAYIMDDVLKTVDEIVENVSKDITKNLLVRINDYNPPHNFDRNIKLELLLCAPSGKVVEYVAQNEVTMVEKREHQR